MAANGARPAGLRGVCSEDRDRDCTEIARRRMGSRPPRRGLAAEGNASLIRRRSAPSIPWSTLERS